MTLARRRVDDAERLVADWLAHSGAGNVSWPERLGGPPDLLVDGKIAVEVRRLFKVPPISAGENSLEQASRPLFDGLRRLLCESGPPDGHGSFFVCARFRRPVMRWADLRPHVRDFLDWGTASGPQQLVWHEIASNFWLRLIKATNTQALRLQLGSWTDEDTGGFVSSDLTEALRHAILEKAQKVSVARTEALEWWLVLVDRHFCAIPPEFSREEFWGQFHAAHPFARIVILSRDPDWEYSLWPLQ